MQNNEVIGHQVFVSEEKPEYVIIAVLNRFDNYIQLAKTNLAERKRKRRNDCKYSVTDNSYESKPLLYTPDGNSTSKYF